MDNKRFLLVGGIGRSGTSILSRLIASSDKAEYFYEPPVFMHLLEELDQLPSNYSWLEFIKTILYDDLMKGALSGRSLNLNRNDLSSVYGFKDETTIEKRFQGSFRHSTLESQINKSVGVIKVLDNIIRFEGLASILPVFGAIIIVRNPIDCARSILSKQWFSDKHLSASSPASLRKMKVHEGFRYPSFLLESEYAKWLNSTELERILIYQEKHILAFQKITKNKDVLFVLYDDLLSDAEETYKRISSRFKLAPGKKTTEIIESILIQNTTDSGFNETFQAAEGGSEVMKGYNNLLKQINNE